MDVSTVSPTLNTGESLEGVWKVRRDAKVLARVALAGGIVFAIVFYQVFLSQITIVTNQTGTGYSYHSVSTYFYLSSFIRTYSLPSWLSI